MLTRPQGLWFVAKAKAAICKARAKDELQGQGKNVGLKAEAEA